ncbi:hypothetical protein N9O93_00895 [bacterium]|jgi:hypothetical protein|nr:hypothetical protein [Hellea sp.]MDA9047708.1 hypothetical protein [Hellea sp.]MDA9225227.1 hypothetical protein [bacterium]
MAEDKAEVSMSRKEYDALTAKAAGDAPKGDGPAYDTRGFKTVEGMEDADINGDGHISQMENKMHLEFKRKELEDADAMRDAQRKMAWFSLFGMLLYPFAVVVASLAGLSEAQATLGSMAPTYFVAVAGIVAAFFGAQAFSKGK